MSKSADRNTLKSGSFELASLLGYRLVRLSSSIGAMAEREAQRVAGLSLPEYRVLTVLYSRGAMGVVALEKTMLIDRAWISRTLNKLTQKKLVVSQSDDVDGRRSQFFVTSQGEEAARTLIDSSLKRQKRIYDGLATEEVKMLESLLSRVQDNVDKANLGG